jgi:hypothetical protein
MTFLGSKSEDSGSFVKFMEPESFIVMQTKMLLLDVFEMKYKKKSYACTGKLPRNDALLTFTVSCCYQFIEAMITKMFRMNPSVMQKRMEESIMQRFKRLMFHADNDSISGMIAIGTLSAIVNDCYNLAVELRLVYGPKDNPFINEVMNEYLERINLISSLSYKEAMKLVRENAPMNSKSLSDTNSMIIE